MAVFLCMESDTNGSEWEYIICAYKWTYVVLDGSRRCEVETIHVVRVELIRERT